MPPTNLEGPVAGLNRTAGAQLAGTARSVVSGLNAWLLPAASGVFLLALWQFAVVFAKPLPTILPAPGSVAAEILQQAGQLAAHAVPTGLQAVAGLALAVVVGVAFAVILTASRLVREAVYPLLLAFQIIPKVALIPVFVLWFGIEAESRILYTMFISFFPISLSTIAGLGSADAGSLKLCRALRATRFQTFMQVSVPYALPHFFAGLEIAATMAMIGIVVAEFISARQGLGYLILTGASRLDTAFVLAAIAVLCIEGLLLFGTVALIEKIVRNRFAL
jgi:NitT/TauT family transport system permease protein